MKLLIGSREQIPGWESFDMLAGANHIGDCSDLERFDNNSIDTIYASHVLEHVPMASQQRALNEWHRVLKPGGDLMIAVPDLKSLSSLFLSGNITAKDKLLLVSMIFGGQSNAHDIHYTGYDFELLWNYLMAVGFREVKQVSELGLFRDTSSLKFKGYPISLNVVAKKIPA